MDCTPAASSAPSLRTDSADRIGGVLGIAGVFIILAQLFLYPQLSKLGLRRSSQLVCALQIPFQVRLPLTWVATPTHVGGVGGETARYWCVVVMMCLKCAFIEMFCEEPQDP